MATIRYSHYLPRYLASIFLAFTIGLCIYFFIWEYNALQFGVQDWAQYSGLQGIRAWYDFIFSSIGFAFYCLGPFVLCICIGLFSLAGILSLLMGKKWFIALIGTLSAIIMPIVYFAINLNPQIRMLCYIGFLSGITALILTILSRKYFVK
jgi:hypothetical protein